MIDYLESIKKSHQYKRDLLIDAMERARAGKETEGELAKIAEDLEIEFALVEMLEQIILVTRKGAEK